MAANHVNVSWSIMMFLLSHEPPQRFAVPVLALTGATSYWASVVASPPGHMSGSGARGTGDLWQLPASWPAQRYREVSCSANDAERCWSAAGRRGADAADVRAREVRPGHSSSEADEQRQTTGSGVGGAKGRGRGEREPAKHAPGAGPGKRVPSAGTRTTSRKAKEDGKVHRAFPPSQYTDAASRILRSQAGCCARGRWIEMAGLRDGPRSPDRGPILSGPSGSVIGRNSPGVGISRSR